MGSPNASRSSRRTCCRSGESSLYPALQRLLLNGWVKAEWGASENNRRARFYTLTAAGKKRLSAERAEFERLVGAIRGFSKWRDAARRS